MDNFYELMQKVLYLVNYKWTIWGFSFSFLEVWFYIALCKLCFWFIWQVFGQMPSFSDSYNDISKPYNYEKERSQASEYWDFVHRRRDYKKP